MLHRSKQYNQTRQYYIYIYSKILQSVLFSHTTFSHMRIRCMLKKVYVILHVRVFFLSTCSVQLIPRPVGKGCTGNEEFRIDPVQRDKRENASNYPLTCYHLPAHFLSPSPAQWFDRYWPEIKGIPFMEPPGENCPLDAGLFLGVQSIIKPNY